MHFVDNMWFTGIKDKNHERFDSGFSGSFTVQGNVHHFIGISQPSPTDQLGYLQMYIYDSKHEVANRTISQPGVKLDSELIKLLQEELDEFNVHVQMFRAFNLTEADPRAKIVLSSHLGESPLQLTSQRCHTKQCNHDA